jgi:hypothetical protein
MRGLEWRYTKEDFFGRPFLVMAVNIEGTSEGTLGLLPFRSYRKHSSDGLSGLEAHWGAARLGDKWFGGYVRVHRHTGLKNIHRFTPSNLDKLLDTVYLERSPTASKFTFEHSYVELTTIIALSYREFQCTAEINPENWARSAGLDGWSVRLDEPSYLHVCKRVGFEPDPWLNSGPQMWKNFVEKTQIDRKGYDLEDPALYDPRLLNYSLYEEIDYNHYLHRNLLGSFDDPSEAPFSELMETSEFDQLPEVIPNAGELQKQQDSAKFTSPTQYLIKEEQKDGTNLESQTKGKDKIGGEAQDELGSDGSTTSYVVKESIDTVTSRTDSERWAEKKFPANNFWNGNWSTTLIKARGSDKFLNPEVHQREKSDAVGLSNDSVSVKLDENIPNDTGGYELRAIATMIKRELEELRQERVNWEKERAEMRFEMKKEMKKEWTEMRVEMKKGWEDVKKGFGQILQQQNRVKDLIKSIAENSSQEQHSKTKSQLNESFISDIREQEVEDIDKVERDYEIGRVAEENVEERAHRSIKHFEGMEAKITNSGSGSFLDSAQMKKNDKKLEDSMAGLDPKPVSKPRTLTLLEALEQQDLESKEEWRQENRQMKRETFHWISRFTGKIAILRNGVMEDLGVSEDPQKLGEDSFQLRKAKEALTHSHHDRSDSIIEASHTASGWYSALGREGHPEEEEQQNIINTYKPVFSRRLLRSVLKSTMDYEGKAKTASHNGSRSSGSSKSHPGRLGSRPADSFTKIPSRPAHGYEKTRYHLAAQFHHSARLSLAHKQPKPSPVGTKRLERAVTNSETPYFSMNMSIDNSNEKLPLQTPSSDRRSNTLLEYIFPSSTSKAEEVTPKDPEENEVKQPESTTEAQKLDGGRKTSILEPSKHHPSSSPDSSSKFTLEARSPPSGSDEKSLARFRTAGRVDEDAEKSSKQQTTHADAKLVRELLASVRKVSTERQALSLNWTNYDSKTHYHNDMMQALVGLAERSDVEKEKKSNIIIRRVPPSKELERWGMDVHNEMFRRQRWKKRLKRHVQRGEYVIMKGEWNKVRMTEWYRLEVEEKKRALRRKGIVRTWSFDKVVFEKKMRELGVYEEPDGRLG